MRLKQTQLACEKQGGTSTNENSAAFEIITEEEYADKYSSKKLRESFIHMADSITTHCTRYGKDNDNPSVFITLFSRNAAEMIQTHTTELLVKDRYEPLTVSELYQFIATMLILSWIRMPTRKAYQEFSPFIEAKHKVKMMSYDRYTQICKRLRGYKISTFFCRYSVEKFFPCAVRLSLGPIISRSSDCLASFFFLRL